MRWNRRSAALRSVVVLVVVMLGLVLAPTSAMAAVSVTRASLSSTGSLSVEGRGALARSTVTVASLESTATGRADRDGRFRVTATGFRASDCTARVTDGSTSATVTLSGCTPSSAPPPTTAVITPDVAELGPGFVGSDFTTFSSTTTTMTLGPDALGPVRFEIVSGALPAGLGLVDPNAGFTPAKSIHASVAGTPTTVQVSTFTVKATDQNGLTATRTYTIRINAARTLDIVPQTDPPALAVGTFSNWWIEGRGGVKPYRWAVTAGQLPPGMSLIQDNPDGFLVRVGGTPTTAGTFTFTLRLTDAQATTVSRTFTLTVPPPDTSTGPNAPTLLAPADGASVTTPVTIDWTEEFDPSLSANGGYNWQVSTTSTFTTLAARDSTLPSVTEDTVSGVPAGTYFWRVQAVDGQLRSSPFSAPGTFTVTAAPAAAASISGLSLNPATVTGGQGSTATVSLSAPAPTGGASVALSSGNTAAATVPASVTVPAGATSATFAVGTSSVTAPTSVTVTGTYGGATRSATLTVNPAASQSATLSVTASGRSGERITSSPAGVDVSVGSTGSASFPTGTAITLSATNGRDVIWSGACSSGGSKQRSCTFTLTGNASVTANVQ